MWVLSYLPLISGGHPPPMTSRRKYAKHLVGGDVEKAFFVASFGNSWAAIWPVAAGEPRMDACDCDHRRRRTRQGGRVVRQFGCEESTARSGNNFIYLITWGRSYSPTFSPDYFDERSKIWVLASLRINILNMFLERHLSPRFCLPETLTVFMMVYPTSCG